MTAPARVETNPFQALAELLLDTARVIALLTREQYRERRLPHLSGSIGGHVRHCLDHVFAFERALTAGRVDYDERRRDPTIEDDRDVAVTALIGAARRVGRLEVACLARPVTVHALVARDGGCVEGLSTIARELAFVVSHTIHHNAQIALLAERGGVTSLPARFGVAPATPALSAGAA